MKINGQDKNLPAPARLIELLVSEGFNPVMVAVLLNGQVIARADFEATMVASGDVLEVITMIGGG